MGFSSVAPIFIRLLLAPKTNRFEQTASKKGDLRGGEERFCAEGKFCAAESSSSILLSLLSPLIFLADQTQKARPILSWVVKMACFTKVDSMELTAQKTNRTYEDEFGLVTVDSH